MVGVEVKAVLIRFNLFYGEIPYFFSIPQVDCVLINKKRTLFSRMQIGFPLFRYKYNDIRGLKESGTIIKECVGSGGQFFLMYSLPARFHTRILRFTTDIFLWEHRQSILMDKPQSHVKHDRRICERCQASNLKIRADGSYSCNHCGYDSTKGK
jgi:ribosomal protein S27AE